MALKPKQRKQLRACVEQERRECGLLFVREADRLPWTFYSPDPDYTAMFAPTAHQFDLSMEVFAEKFLAWGQGLECARRVVTAGHEARVTWRISDSPRQTAASANIANPACAGVQAGLR